MLSQLCVLPISFFSQYVQNWSIFSFHPVWSTGESLVKLCHHLLKSTWKSFCWLRCVWVWFNFPLSLWEQWPCLHCSTKCIPISACHPYPQPCPFFPSLCLPTLEEWPHNPAKSQLFASPSSPQWGYQQDTWFSKDGAGLAVFMPLDTALCFPVHVQGVVFPLTLGVQELGQGQQGKIAEKKINWGILFFYLFWACRVHVSGEKKIKIQVLGLKSD